VFDKGRKTGGRLSGQTDNTEQYDFGAHYFTARDANFKRAVAAWQSKGWVRPWTGRFGKIDGGVFSRQDDKESLSQDIASGLWKVSGTVTSSNEQSKRRPFFAEHIGGDTHVQYSLFLQDSSSMKKKELVIAAIGAVAIVLKVHT